MWPLPCRQLAPPIGWSSVIRQLPKGVPLRSVEVSARSVLIRAWETLTKGRAAVSRYHQLGKVTKVLQDRVNIQLAALGIEAA